LIWALAGRGHRGLDTTVSRLDTLVSGDCSVALSARRSQLFEPQPVPEDFR